jgi:hypothetical protein
LISLTTKKGEIVFSDVASLADLVPKSTLIIVKCVYRFVYTSVFGPIKKNFEGTTLGMFSTSAWPRNNTPLSALKRVIVSSLSLSVTTWPLAIHRAN